MDPFVLVTETATMVVTVIIEIVWLLYTLYLKSIGFTLVRFLLLDILLRVLKAVTVA